MGNHVSCAQQSVKFSNSEPRVL